MLALALSALAAPTLPPTRIQVQLGHTFPIHAVAWSPDGRLAASAGNDETVRVWDVDTGRLLWMTATDADPVVAFASDGALVIGDRGYVRRVDVTTGEVTGELEIGGPKWLSADGAFAAVAQSGPGNYDAMGNYICHMIIPVDTAAMETVDPLLTETEALCPEAYAVAVGDGLLAGTDLNDTRVRSWGGGTISLDLPATSALALGDGVLLGATGGAGLSQPHLAWWSLADGERLGRVKKAFPGGTSNLVASADGRLVASSSDEGALVVIDLASGKRVLERDGVPSVLAFSPDGSQLLAGHRRSDDGDVDVIDAHHGLVTHTFAGRVPGAAAVALGGGRALVGGTDGTVAVWELATLGLERTFRAGYAPILGLEVSADGRRALVVSIHPDVDAGEPAGIWDLATGERVATLGDEVASAAAWLDGSRAVAGSRSGALWTDAARVDGLGPVNAVAVHRGSGRIYACAGDLVGFDAGLAQVWAQSMGASPCREIAVSPDGTRVAISGSLDREWGEDFQEWVEVWNPAADELVWRTDYDWNGGPVLGLAFAEDGGLVVSGEDGFVRRLDADGYELATVEHFGPVRDVAVADGLVLSAGLSDAARLWRPDGEAVQLASDDRGEWILWGADGVFDASRNGGDLVAVVRGAEVWGVDQFAVHANRPDLLLERMQLGSAELVAHWRARYERRVAKLGLAAHGLDEGPVPVVTVLSSEKDEQTLSFSFGATSAEPLVRADVFVNDVPLWAGGMPISGHEVAEEVIVPLVAGDNVVEVSVVDAAGVESRRALHREFQPDERQGALWVVALGVSDYADPAIADLGFADDDARDVAARLSALPGFSAVHTKVLVDAEVTPAAIDGLRGFVEQAGVHDTLVVFVAGHGLHDDDPNATYYFLGHDTDLDDLAGTAATFERVESLVQGVRPIRKLLLLDTCESGEAEEGEVVAATSGGGTARGARVVATVAASAPKPWIYARDRFVYNDLSRRTGAIVFSASRGGELSYEADGHGYFTAALLDGLSGTADVDGDGVVEVDELRDHVAAAVAERSAGRQHPVVDRDNLKMKFGFPVR